MKFVILLKKGKSFGFMLGLENWTAGKHFFFFFPNCHFTIFKLELRKCSCFLKRKSKFDFFYKEGHTNCVCVLFSE